MSSTVRLLPYTKKLVLLALYDVLEQEHSEYKKDGQSGDIVTTVNVYGNTSEFSVNIREKQSAAETTVTLTCPCEDLSEKGCRRAVDYLADRVEQLLENEIKTSAFYKAKNNL